MNLVSVPYNIGEILRGEVQTGLCGGKIEKCKLTSFNVKVGITSLNLHFWL